MRTQWRKRRAGGYLRRLVYGCGATLYLACGTCPQQRLTVTAPPPSAPALEAGAPTPAAVGEGAAPSRFDARLSLYACAVPPVAGAEPDASVAVPTLLIIGTRDPTALGKDRVAPEVRETLGLYGQLGRNARDAIPEARLVKLPGIGHLPQFQAYDAYWEALRCGSWSVYPRGLQRAQGPR